MAFEVDLNCVVSAPSAGVSSVTGDNVDNSDPSNPIVNNPTDEEIETAYNNKVSVVTQLEAEEGTSTDVKRWTPERVKQAIEALATNILVFAAPKTANYTVASDSTKVNDRINAATITITIPSDMLNEGEIKVIDFEQDCTPTWTAGTDVIIQNTASFPTDIEENGSVAIKRMPDVGIDAVYRLI